MDNEYSYPPHKKKKETWGFSVIHKALYIYFNLVYDLKVYLKFLKINCNKILRSDLYL